MVVELDAGCRGRPPENGFARNGPDALFSALLYENEAVSRDA